MRIAVVTLGTRGDVQPFVELAHRLHVEGHDVVFAAPPRMGALTTVLPVPVVEFGPDVAGFLASERGQRIILSGRTSVLARELFALNNRYSREIDATIREITADADVVVSGSLSEEKAAVAALSASAALFSVHLAPFAKNSAVPHALLDVPDLGAFGNRRTYDLVTVLRSAAALRDSTRMTEVPLHDRLSPRLMRRARMTVIDAYSRHLLPTTPSSSATAPGLDPTGFIHLSPELRPDTTSGDRTREVLDWIDSDGRRTIYVGFGSMPIGDPSALTRMLTDTCRNLGVRAVWCTGWTDAPEGVIDERVMTVHEVDHDRVLPACAAAVHHGGAGTTAVAMRHGCPQVIMPFFWDQQFWGRMITNNVLGTHLHYRTARPSAVTEAIRYALSPVVEHRARHYANAVAAEHGTQNAITKIVTGMTATPRR